MTTVCEITFAAGPRENPVRDEFAAAARCWFALPGLVSLDLYTPAIGAAHDRYVQADRASASLAILTFHALEALESALREAAFDAGLSCMSKSALTCTAMRRIDYPIVRNEGPAPLTARFSYVVRYHRPAEDEALFIRNYIETHPPLLGRLPGIRNVMCYLPLPWRHPGGLPNADYMVGNEVVFDDAEAFNAAMASPVRDELRAHYRRFPPFTGRNTHYAMDRKRLAG